MALSIAIDLGTTNIKGGVLNDSGALTGVVSVSAPPVTGTGLVRESSVEDYLKAVEALVEGLDKKIPKTAPLGIACQRSTFLLWERETGKPLTPLISWQDRRTADWCKKNKDKEEFIIKKTGLPLSPHYAGPKLAFLLEQDSGLKKEAARGKILFGTLETYLLWGWTAGRIHETDLTMAARTLLADISTGEWSDDLLQIFGVPRDIFPAISSSTGRAILLAKGRKVTSTIADQSAALLFAMGNQKDRCVVNLGTGGFVICPTGSAPKYIPRYLTAPLLANGKGENLFGLEGTINGIASSVEQFPVDNFSQGEDSGADCFCLPDSAGVGAPHWAPNLNLVFSKKAETLSDREKGRLVLEGIIFRVREIWEDIKEKNDYPLILTGGLSRDRLIGQGLADCLNRKVEIPEEREGTLSGAATLAAGLAPGRPPKTVFIEPNPRDSTLPSKYGQWKEWVKGIVMEI